MPDLKSIIGKVAAGQKLTRGEAEEAFGVIMSGEATPAQIGSFPSAMRLRPYLRNSASDPSGSGPPAQNVHLSIFPRLPKFPALGYCGAPKGQA